MEWRKRAPPAATARLQSSCSCPARVSAAPTWGRTAFPWKATPWPVWSRATRPRCSRCSGKPLPCGCGRDWGCVEAYTTISGLPHLLEEKLKEFPDHELAASSAPVKEKVLSLRTRAQKGDPLALSIFDFQAKVMGLHVANLAMTLDPGIVVIGGGLMDRETTTPEFRERYIRIVRETARPYLWNSQRDTIQIVPASLGDLSQAIGAALVALFVSQGHGTF